MTERAIQDTYELQRLAAEAEVDNVIDESADLLDQATSDAVYRYFRDVGGHRLLTHNEEIEYSRAVRAGLEARKQLEAGTLSLDMYKMREPLAKAGLVYVDRPEDA